MNYENHIFKHSKKNNLTYYVRVICVAFILMMSGVMQIASFAEAPPPGTPPEKNPHPPLSQQDQLRVAFAQKAVQEHLKKQPFQLLSKWPPVSPPSHWSKYPSHGKSFHSKTIACLAEPECVKKDAAYVDELIWFHASLGPVIEMKYAHIVPWSWDNYQKNKKGTSASTAKIAAESIITYQEKPQLKADEYMVHIYVRTQKSEDTWYHLDVILSEDEKGNPVLRHFFAIPIPPQGGELPPGVVC